MNASDIAAVTKGVTKKWAKQRKAEERGQEPEGDALERAASNRIQHPYDGGDSDVEGRRVIHRPALGGLGQHTPIEQVAHVFEVPLDVESRSQRHLRELRHEEPGPEDRDEGERQQRLHTQRGVAQHRVGARPVNGIEIPLVGDAAHDP